MQKTILTMLMILLAVTVTANAATVWNPAANNDANDFTEDGSGTYWHIPENWTNGVPDAVDELGVALNDGKAVFNVANAAECIVNTTDAICNQIAMGDGGTDLYTNLLRIVDGGILTTRESWSTPGLNRPGTWIIEEGGELNIGGHLWCGMNDGADATIFINGGTITIKDALDLGRNTGSKGTIYLNKGLLTTRYMPDDSDTEGSLLDITYGSFAIKNNYTSPPSRLWSRIDAGTIVGFGGRAELKVERVNDFIGTEDYTVVTADDPMNPYPAMGEEVYINNELEMTWSNLFADVGDDVYVDVWFGTDSDEDSESYDMVKVVDADTLTDEGLNATSAIADASAVGTYFWRVDSYVNGVDHVNDANAIEGILYNFSTTDDLEPTVEILTKNTLTWAGEPVDLLAIVTDTGSSQLHIEWSSTADLNVTIANVVITETEPGVYEVTATAVSDSHQPNTTITLTAWDDKNLIEKAGTDTVLVDFADNSCQGARGGFMRLDNVHLADFDADCVITLADFATFAGEWLISPDEGRDSFELTEAVAK